MKKFLPQSFTIPILSFLIKVAISQSESESWIGLPSIKFSSSEIESEIPLENAGIFENQTEINSRPKRFVDLNIYGTMDVGFLLTFPFTIVLPPASTEFNAWKYKRSIRSLKQDVYYEDDPILRNQLEKISTYFDLIQIPESACQRRAICEFSSSPDKYFPIADIFLNQVRDPTLLLYTERREILNLNDLNSTEKYDNLFKLYNVAADFGQSYGEEACHTEFSRKCPFSSQQRLNMPLFQFWKSIEKALDIKIQEKVF